MLGFVVFLCLVMFSYWACIIAELPKEGLRCFNGSCLPGYHCNEKKKCVKNATGEVTPPKEGVSPEEKPVIADKQGEQPVTKEEPPTTDGGGPEEKVVTEAPPTDQPQGIQCSYRIPNKPELCPIPQSDTNSCEQLAKTFQLASESLPQALTDVAAVSNGESWNLLFQNNPKIYIHVLGGRSGGKASNKVYVSKVELSGKLVNIGKWALTSTLLTARYGASAFLIRGYLYVVGGLADGDKPVESMERAKVKADGTLEAFEKVGDWPGSKAREGLAYRYGYFYRAGGLEAGKPIQAVGRILLQPDGKSLGTPEKLPELPEGRTGPMVSTPHFLYLLGANGSRQVLIAQLQSSGKIEGWCKNTALPKNAKSFTAFADARRIMLLGIQDSKDQLEKNIFISPLFSSKDSYGGGMDSWRCSRSEKGLNAKLVTPRYRTAAVVVFDFVFLLGGVDANGKALKSVEKAKLAYRAAGCDLDRDITPNNFDYCPNTYATGNKNSDQPSTVKRPGSTGYIERFGPGDACEAQQMLQVSAGKFTRGEGPKTDESIKLIELRGFYIDPHEVTNKDYAECVKQKKCTAPSKSTSATRATYYGDSKFDNFPVVNITWEQAKAYCTFRGKRLPSEAEWEKAARGLARNVYPWGDSKPTCEQAQSSNCTVKDTLAIGKRPKGASPYGAHDMAGNVREWVADYYKSDYYKDSPSANPKGPVKGTQRVIRGGSFKSNPDLLRVSARDKLKPTEHADDLGFRCAQRLFLPAN